MTNERQPSGNGATGDAQAIPSSYGAAGGDVETGTSTRTGRGTTGGTGTAGVGTPAGDDDAALGDDDAALGDVDAALNAEAGNDPGAR